MQVLDVRVAFAEARSMHLAYVILTLIAIAMNVYAAVADFVRADFVVTNSNALNLPLSWLPTLGALKGVGALGLLLGLLGFRAVGLAAAVGLVLFFIGALIVNVRGRTYSTIAFPGAFFAVAVAALVLAVAR